MADLKCLTTKEVARLCRVSDATVKRWEDAGLLQSERTSGGHRRFRAEEIIRFQREQGLGLKQCHGDESVITAQMRRRSSKNYSDSTFFHSLFAGCEEASANILIGEHLNGKSVTEIFDNLVCPTMRQIGELWFDDEISVTQEHLTTRTVHSAVYKFRSVLTVPKMTGKLAMCCAMEGDLHELPTHFTQVTVENEGWEVMNFGANTPLFCLAKEVLKHSPQIVCISGTVMNDVERLSRDYKDFREQTTKLKIPILFGGRIFQDKRISQRFPAEFYAESFTEAAAIIQNLTKN